MDYKVFYSWQSDLDSRTNEQFIEEALKNAIEKLNKDSSLSVNLIFDRDIANIPGSPEIAATILAKIEESNIFVGDVSIINSKHSQDIAGTKNIRKTPNPNVLVELGYALKTLGTGKIVLVNNLAYGKHEELPFDFRHRYVVGYSLSQNDSKSMRETEYQKLEALLMQELQKIVLSFNKRISTEINPLTDAINAIKNSQPNQILLIDDFIDWMMKELDECSPPFPRLEGDEIEHIVQSIDKSLGLMLGFTELSSVLVRSNSSEILYFYKRIFERIVSMYNPPLGFTGSFVNARMRFYQFIGHEAFISLVTLLLDAEKMESIADILNESLFVENDIYAGGAQNVFYTYISMIGESARGVSRPLVNAFTEKMDKRHSEGELANLVPAIKIGEYEYFLTLRNDQRKWHAILNTTEQVPRFLIKAKKNKYAQKLLKPLAVNSIDEIKQTLSLRTEQGAFLRWRFNFNPDEIGSE